LKIVLEGKVNQVKWKATNICEKDIPYFQKHFNNTEIMKGFASGQSRSPESIKERILNSWISRFENLQPHGGLTIWNITESKKPLRIGHFVAGGGEEKGVSEIAYSLEKEYWGKGICTCIVAKILELWVPEVQRIAHIPDNELNNTFRCFDGQALRRLDATASPINISSWKILEKNNFHSAFSKTSKAPASLQKLINSFIKVKGKILTERMEDFEKSISHLIKKGDMKVDTRYEVTDLFGEKKTLSFSKRFARLKYHYEYDAIENLS